MLQSAALKNAIQHLEQHRGNRRGMGIRPSRKGIRILTFHNIHLADQRFMDGKPRDMDLHDPLDRKLTQKVIDELCDGLSPPGSRVAIDGP